MGFRYRKIINLGGCFKINLNKSGIGYSWNINDHRFTKIATDTSYIYEADKNNINNSRYDTTPDSQQPLPSIDNNHYDTRNIINVVASEIVSEELRTMCKFASKALRLNKLANIGFWISLILSFGFPILFLFSIFFLILKIFVKIKGTINLEYNIDTDQQSLVDERIKPMIKITESAKVWRIMQTSKVINKKYTSGASNTVNRTTCKASTKAPFPFKTNLQIASFKAGKETLLFLPDKLFLIQGNKIDVLNYSDIAFSTYTTRFIESNGIPKDSQVVAQTWKYVNKSGEPDRRFKNNRQLPICLYGELKLTSISGLNTIFMYSNPNL